MVLSSYSKINLSLLVNSKQKRGLHNIQSYFCLINLKDKIKIKRKNSQRILIYENTMSHVTVNVSEAPIVIDVNVWYANISPGDCELNNPASVNDF